MKKKALTSILCLLASASMLAGCSNPNEITADSTTALGTVTETPAPTQEASTETPTPEPTQEAVTETPTPEPTQDPYALPEGQMYSYLTGEPVSTEEGMKKPYCVMINNLQPAVPQSGISQADVIYEAMVEGTITRMMAVFQDPAGIEKIGPCRSARHYFVDFNYDMDGIYCHFGGSPFAFTRFQEDGLTTINGTAYDGSGAFFRTSDREAPHNAYASGDGLISIASGLGLSTTHRDGYTGIFSFNYEDTPLEDGDGVTEASRVNIPFSWNMPYFEYNADDGLYYRFEYDAPQVDQENGQQLAFKNVIVEYVEQGVISEKGHLDLLLYNVGEGLYITDGKAKNITWVKQGRDQTTYFTDSSGNTQKINPGKTMIIYVPAGSKVTFGDEQPVIGPVSTAGYIPQPGTDQSSYGYGESAEEAGDS